MSAPDDFISRLESPAPESIVTDDLFGNVTQQRIAALHERIGAAPAEALGVESARHEARFIGGFYDDVIAPIIEEQHRREREAQS